MSWWTWWLKSVKKGLEINKKQSFVVSKNATKPTHTITVKGETLQQVDRFTYVPRQYGNNTRKKTDQEINRRIGITETAY